MSGASYTPEELAEFDRLTREMSSTDQVTRIMGRLHTSKFGSSHGKAKCDAMFAELKRREARNA
ncbi:MULTISPECIES: hypothetical protein [unclassified Bradyrhizobium]|uniref:hypothetical protein n=1 Tax=unclassified Bradyrhizobium TaxID=2631580 RepID=UPI00291690FC|nr:MULTISPECIES: hypothetical protein [unclassified Bradyrhizobium]